MENKGKLNKVHLTSLGFISKPFNEFVKFDIYVG